MGFILVRFMIIQEERIARSTPNNVVGVGARQLKCLFSGSLVWKGAMPGLMWRFRLQSNHNVL
jgi:hypothetical protein